MALNSSKSKPKDRTVKIIDYSEVSKELHAADWSLVYNANNVDDAVREFGIILSTAVQRNTKLRRVSRSKFIMRPWMTPGLLRCARHRDRLHQIHRDDPKDEQKELVYKRYRNFYQELIRKLKTEHDDREFENNKHNPKKLWKTVRNVSESPCEKNVATELTNVKGTVVESLNYCNNYFSTVGANLAHQHISQLNKSEDEILSGITLTDPSPKTFYMQPTDVFEINKIIMNLKADSAPGLDGYSVTLIRSIKDEIIEPLFDSEADLSAVEAN
ncbi:hypothetical protein NE865_00591 [Phthorimaea operculella]|nr:hypothetical protein NE865_00591 [Phthorimaea operculella]